MMATPRPPWTRGSSPRAAYTRRPGREMRRTPEIVRSRAGPYFSSTVSVRLGPSPSMRWVFT